MKKGIAKLIVLLIAVVFIVLLTGILVATLDKNKINQKLAKLDSLPLQDLDSLEFQIPRGKALFIMYFNSTCSHCESELIDIRDNIEKFQDYNILLVSMEPLKILRTISGRYSLHHANVFVTKIEPSETFNSFGSLSTPHIFVYGRDGVLIKEFKGPFTVDAMFRSLKGQK